jgi:hypothetical protein
MRITDKCTETCKQKTEKCIFIPFGRRKKGPVDFTDRRLWTCVCFMSDCMQTNLTCLTFDNDDDDLLLLLVSYEKSKQLTVRSACYAVKIRTSDARDTHLSAMSFSCSGHFTPHCRISFFWQQKEIFQKTRFSIVLLLLLVEDETSNNITVNSQKRRHLSHHLLSSSSRLVRLQSPLILFLHPHPLLSPSRPQSECLVPAE